MTQTEVRAKLENIESVGYKITIRQIVIGLFTIITVLSSSVGSAVWWYAAQVQGSKDFKVYIKSEFKEIKKEDSIHWVEVRRDLDLKSFKDSIYLDQRFRNIESKMGRRFSQSQGNGYVYSKRDPITGLTSFFPVKK